MRGCSHVDLEAAFREEGEMETGNGGGQGRLPDGLRPTEREEGRRILGSGGCRARQRQANLAKPSLPGGHAAGERDLNPVA